MRLAGQACVPLLRADPVQASWQGGVPQDTIGMEFIPLQKKALKRCKTEQPLPGKPVPVATNPSPGR
jgi:hypothetical protein